MYASLLLRRNTSTSDRAPLAFFAAAAAPPATDPPVARPVIHAETSVENVGVPYQATASATPAANDADDDDEDEVNDAQSTQPHRASTAISGEKKLLRQIIAGRLRQARSASGLSQSEASALLGSSTPTQLNLWEMNRRSPSLIQLVKVAELYACSVDYLVGTSTDMLLDPSAGLRHACLRGVRSMLNRVAATTVNEVSRHARMIGPNVSSVGELLAAGDRLLDTVVSFQRLNLPVFQEQRGSASIVSACEAFETALLDARKKARLASSLDEDIRRQLAAIRDVDVVGLGVDTDGD